VVSGLDPLSSAAQTQHLDSDASVSSGSVAAGIHEHSLQELQRRHQREQQSAAETQLLQLRQQEADMVHLFVKSIKSLPPSPGRSVYCTKYDNR
jgi:hypothetical protein